MLLHVAVADGALGRVGPTLDYSTVRPVGAAAAVEAVGVGGGLTVAEVGAVTASADAPGRKKKFCYKAIVVLIRNEALGA